MSNNGEETFNEILCHQGLGHLFNSYSINPLFSDAPDGRIGAKYPYVNVEIKSRFSQLIDRLSGFYAKISDLLPILDEYDLVCKMEILKLDKKVNDQVLGEEIKFISENINPESVCEKSIHRTTELIEYEMKFSCSISEKKPFVYFTQAHVDNCIFSTETSRYLGPDKSCGKTSFTVILDPLAKETYSNSIIKDCLDRIKNMPDEPRCIVIYSNILGDVYLKEFFKEVSTQYVRKKPGTAILGITGHFLERTDENKIGIDVFGVGNDIKQMLKSNSNHPTYLDKADS